MTNATSPDGGPVDGADAGDAAKPPRADAGDAGDGGAPDADAATLDDAMADVHVPPPPGEALVKGSGLRLLDLTTDGYAVYSDARGAVWAVPLAGGTPIAISNGDFHFGTVFASGSVVFAWPTAGTSDMVLWTAARGATMVKATIAGAATASHDGSTIAYLTNLSAATNAFDLVVAKSDLSESHTVLSQVTFARSGCPRGDYRFAGTSNVVVTAQCNASGSLLQTWSSFSPPSYARVELGTDLVQGQFGVSVDAAGEHALAVNGAGALESIELATGAKAVLAARGAAQSAFFVEGGQKACWTTTSQGFACAPVATPASVTTLASSGVGVVWPFVSDDGAWTLFDDAFAYPKANGMHLLSLAAPADAIALEPATVQTGQWYRSFTDDSRFVFYTRDLDTATMTGTLVGHALGAGAPMVLGDHVLVATGAGASRVVFGAHTSNGDKAGSTSDIELADLASAQPPKLIVAGADALFQTSQDDKTLVYAYGAGALDDAGLYVLPLP